MILVVLGLYEKNVDDGEGIVSVVQGKLQWAIKLSKGRYLCRVLPVDMIWSGSLPNSRSEQGPNRVPKYAPQGD